MEELQLRPNMCANQRLGHSDAVSCRKTSSGRTALLAGGMSGGIYGVANLPFGAACFVRDAATDAACDAGNDRSATPVGRPLFIRKSTGQADTPIPQAISPPWTRYAEPRYRRA
jgi:hypothetical protein